MEIPTGYGTVIYAMGTMGLLMLVQILVNDWQGITARHVPGTPVEADHGSLLFRASRTVANTNESIAVFILLVLFCILMGASADYTAIAAWGYVVSRMAYAACYYANLKLMRSVVFGLSLVFLVGLLIVGAVT